MPLWTEFSIIRLCEIINYKNKSKRPHRMPIIEVEVKFFTKELVGFYVFKINGHYVFSYNFVLLWFNNIYNSFYVLFQSYREVLSLFEFWYQRTNQVLFISIEVTTDRICGLLRHNTFITLLLVNIFMYYLSSNLKTNKNLT